MNFKNTKRKMNLEVNRQIIEELKGLSIKVLNPNQLFFSQFNNKNVVK